LKTVIQRVTSASVTVEGNRVADIQKGLLVLVGIEDADSQEDINWLSSKIVNLRIFGDANEVMNLSVKDVDGDIIVISQFTLQASTKKGNRPSYLKAAKHEIAIPMYECFVQEVEQQLGKKVQTGIFAADMKVNELTNMAQLTEEVGEVARIIARRYGEQSEKESDKNKDLGEELADVVFVVLCLANQTGIDLQAAFDKKMDMKSIRDKDRHKNNEKLK
jgi:D-tyrosyl-tRNA(Tyr) deacylase